MTSWQRWLRRPRTIFVRGKACFQIHLWIGLAIGLSVVVLSLTGSAIVFRRELNIASGLTVRRWASKTGADSIPGRAGGGRTSRVSGLRHRAGRRDVQRRFPPSCRSRWERDGSETIERVFNAYTGQESGNPFPMTSGGALLWVVTLHDDLLDARGTTGGRFWNGVGSILTALLCLTGAVVWWPGIASWRRGVSVRELAIGLAAIQLRSPQRHGILVFRPDQKHSGRYPESFLSIPTAFMAVVEAVQAGPPDQPKSVHPWTSP